jgi:2-oxoglutarate dehydrogenase E1 component
MHRYPQAKTWKWVQEEPENMGAWWFVRPLLEGILKQLLIYVGRKSSASPATGFPKIYRRDQDAILDQAFKYNVLYGKAMMPIMSRLSITTER